MSNAEYMGGVKPQNKKCRSIYFSFLGALNILKIFFLFLFRFFSLRGRIALSCHNFCNLFRFYTLVQVNFSFAILYWYVIQLNTFSFFLFHGIECVWCKY